MLQIKRMGVGIQMEERQLLKDEFITNYNVRKEIKCCGDSEILHRLVHDTTCWCYVDEPIECMPPN